MKTKVLAGILLLAAGFMNYSCSDDTDYVIHHNQIISSVVTGNAEVTAVSAIVSGAVSDLTGQKSSAYTVGAYYSTKDDPQQNGTKVTGVLDEDGNFTVTLAGLTKGITYYYCSFVTLQDKVTYYGDVKSFTTTDAQIATADAASVTPVSVLLGGTLNGVADMIQSESTALVYGVKLSISDNDTDLQTGREFTAKSTSNSFNVEVSGLLPATTYYYIAYMRLNGKDVFADKKQFTTADFEVEYVNLGLSVNWASCNLGAITPEEAGGLYGWGDVTGLFATKNYGDYGPETDISGTESDICARGGGGSRMPTFVEIRELIDNCNSEWTQMNGVNGFRFTAKNGKSIFLPATGYREENKVFNNGISGNYWSGTIDPSAVNYAYLMNFENNQVSWTEALRYQGMSIRPVKTPEIVNLYCDNDKLRYGHVEQDKKSYRIEIYNEYGETKLNPPINTGLLNFENNCVIRFKLSGFKFKEGAAGEYRAGMQYAAKGWYPSYWSTGNSKYDCHVTGDGEYTVWCESPALSSGAEVFCIDIMDDIIDDLVDVAAAKAEILSIELDRPTDWLTSLQVDNSKILFLNKDDDKVNGRIEIYNEYGATKNNPGVNTSDVSFNGRMSISFDITGIDGNLVAGADGPYAADISYAAASWDPSYWGGGIGATKIEKDGTYEVYCQLNGDCVGAVVWCIEVSGIWKDLINPELVKININSITTEN